MKTLKHPFTRAEFLQIKQVSDGKIHNNSGCRNLKTLTNLGMYTTVQIREFGNEMGSEANYMEIFPFAHFSRRQSRGCNQYVYTSDKNTKCSIIPQYTSFPSMFSVLVLVKVRIISNSLIVYILDTIRLQWMVLIKLQNNPPCCGVHSKLEQLIHSLKLIKI